jgi:hypothetical protein
LFLITLKKQFVMKKTDAKPKAVYKCTQQELYAIARLMWWSCKENATDFEALKPKYTVAFINGKIVQVAAAEAIPDKKARTEPYKTERANLDAKGLVCLKNWQSLKRYIYTAYKGDKTVYEAKLEAAGADYYLKASKGNWEELKGMLTSGLQFIVNHSAELSANDNMPAGFEALFETDAILFNTTYDLFKDKEQDSEEGTTDKITANNAVYADLMEMAKDGVHIYRRNAAKRERFIWADVKELVSSEPGSVNNVTVSGLVKDNVTGALIANAEIVLGPHTFTSNANGEFSKSFYISQPTTYNITVTAEGYVPIDDTFQFTPNVDVTQDIDMQRVVIETYQPTLTMGTTVNAGDVDAGATGIRITLISGSEVTVGLSTNGTVMSGNTETVNTTGTAVDRTMSELGGYKPYVMAQNNTTGDVTVKIEILG